MKMNKKLVAMLMTTVLTMGVLAGCGSSEKPEGPKEPSKPSTEDKEDKTPAEDGLEHVDLVWYYHGDPMPDQDMIFEKANAIIEDEINATVKFIPIEGGEYEQKMQTKYASGEAGDITWTASWRNNYAQNVAKGNFIAIDELLEKTPELKDIFTEDQWSAVKIKGEIYGVPSAQIFASTNMVALRKDLVDKYELDVDSVKRIGDLEPWIDRIREEEDILFEWHGKGRFEQLTQAYNVTALNPIAAISTDDDSRQVFNMYDSPHFKEYLEFAKSWADKGYIASDGMVLKDQEAEKQGNKIIGHVRGNYKPGVSAAETQNWGQEMIAMPVSDTFLDTGGITATINAITATSKNPERALMLLQLVNTNSDLFNLLSFGIEGEHYEIVADNTVKITAPDRYKAANWVLGNTFIGYLIEGQEADTWERTIEMNNTATPSPTLGFTFDGEPVKTQMAQINTVIDEYLPGLGNGAVDIDKAYPEFIEKLKSAGADDVIAETQRQVDEWAANAK